MITEGSTPLPRPLPLSLFHFSHQRHTILFIAFRGRIFGWISRTQDRIRTCTDFGHGNHISNTFLLSVERLLIKQRPASKVRASTNSATWVYPHSGRGSPALPSIVRMNLRRRTLSLLALPTRSLGGRGFIGRTYSSYLRHITMRATHSSLLRLLPNMAA